MIATLCVSVLHVVHNPLNYNIQLQGGPKHLLLPGTVVSGLSVHGVYVVQ